MPEMRRCVDEQGRLAIGIAKRGGLLLRSDRGIEERVDVRVVQVGVELRVAVAR